MLFFQIQGKIYCCNIQKQMLRKHRNMEDDEIEKMDCFMECTIDDDKYSAGDAGFGRGSFGT